MRFGLTILLIFISTVLSNAQQTSTCLSESQLLNLQSLSPGAVNNVLTGLGWNRIDDNENQTKKYFDYYLDYSIVKWQNKKTNFIEGVLCLYHKTGQPNLIVYHNPDNICFNYLLKNQSGTKPISKTTNKLLKSFSYYKSGGILLDFLEYQNDNSNLRFSILIYNKSSLDTQILIAKDTLARRETRRLIAIANEIAKEEALKRNESNRQRSIQFALNTGDSLFQEGNFDEAISQYILAKNFLKKEEKTLLKKLDSKISNSKENVNRIAIENFITYGDTFYNQKEFDLALSKYEDALSFYNSNSSNFDSKLVDDKIKIKITNTKAILVVLNKRKTYQSYLKEDPGGFYSFRDKNYSNIGTMISELKGSGNVSYSAYLNFDTLGINNSYIKINSISRKSIRTFINRINISDLTPTRELDYFIPSRDELSFSVFWQTYKLRAKSGLSQIKIKPIEKIPSDFNFKIGAYINHQTFPRGIYTFEVLEKNVNEKTFRDLNLIRYRNNCGPFNSIYSLILPGWGTSKVADTKKGIGRMTLFLLSAAISTGSKIYSDLEFNKYKITSPQYGAEKYYEYSNVANKVFLISGGIAAGIYVYDFFWVLGKGIKNINKSKEFKYKLKNGPIKVIDSPLKPL